MHPAAIKTEALVLSRAGLNDCEVARRLAIPRTTVRDWRSPRYRSRRLGHRCPRCWRCTPEVRFGAGDYALLLGLYLGDGSIVKLARSYRLRIHLDARYPGIIAAAAGLLRRGLPQNRVGLVRRRTARMVDVSVYFGHLPCLLPQHGAGHKHKRPIVLETWQRALVAAEPFAFLRGLIWSDGSV